MSTSSIPLRCHFHRYVKMLPTAAMLCLGTTVTSAVEPNGAQFYGALSGGFDVSPAGAASYSIPIEVPPGIGGMTPRLSLNYNSQSGNGLLGMGWSLGGLSAITRCPATLAQDGFIDPVDLDSNDRYCLDGQRLISVTNTGCAGGTEYRTEIDAYARVCAYGTAGVGPAWFKVWTKAGLVMDYANTSDSRIEAQGSSSVLAWAVNRIEDAVGNYLAVAYHENNVEGEYYPERIEYAGNAAQGMTPYHSVVFVYEPRSDTTQNYTAGKLSRSTVRMINVQVYAGQESIRDYRLAYTEGVTTGRSRVQTLQLCDGVALTSQCLPETELTWTDGAASFGAAINTGRSNGAYQIVHPMDVDADGRQDLSYCSLPPVGSTYAYWHILISTGNGFNAAIKTGVRCDNHAYSLPIDYDTDGKVDLLVPYANSRWYVLRSTGSGFSLMDTGMPDWGYNNKPVVMDANGDGRDDLVLAASGYWHIRINNGNGFNAAVSTGIASTNWAHRQRIDYDGDGRDDLLVPYANNRWYVLKSTGTTFQLVDSGISNTGYDNYPQVMDVNGDGRQDLVVNGSTKLIHINSGDRFLPAISTVGAMWPSATFQMDYNADGKMDLIMPGPPSSTSMFIWHVLQSTGDGFSTINTGVASMGYDPLYGKYPKPGDYNGDGFMDLALDANNVWNLLLHTSLIPDQLTEIVGGSGKRINLTHKALTDPAVYTAGNAAYPQLSVRAPIYVISRVAQSNGVGSTNARDYRYTDARIDLRRRSFLGFGTVTETDEQARVRMLTTYSLTFPSAGQVVSVDERLVDGTAPLKTIANAWTHTQPFTGVYQVYISESVERTYELGATLVSTVTKAHSLYDAYGNPGLISVTATGGGESYSKTTAGTYDNDMQQWHLARLNTVAVTSTSPSGVQTRNSSFEYHPGTGLLAAEIIEPNDPQLMLRTEYGYDAYGDKTSVTVRDSGSGSYPITMSTSTTTYDYSQLSVDGTYTVTSTNAKGHSETQVIDARFGKPLSLTGPNGLNTYWRYDSFGQQTREIRADDTETTVSMVWCDSSCAGVAHAVYKRITQTTGSAPTNAYFDNFGRELRSEVVSLDGRAVHKDTQYNNLGQVTRVSRPYFAGSTPYWAGYRYDAIGRVWEEAGPDGGNIETTYNGLTTTIRRYSTSGDYDQSVIRITNVEGSLIQVIDEGYRTTRYEYDPFGNLTRVTDPANNATLMAYDKRGRKASMDDPDMGHWEYRYDALGQLRWQKDAKNQIVTMNYDVLGRMTSRFEPEGTSTWRYDQAANNGIGKPWKVVGSDGYSETFIYDTLGRPAQTLQSFNGTNLTTTTSYDGMGRVDTLTYPNGFRLKHGYTSVGYLNKVSNADNANEVFWTAQEMSPDGQISSELLGNGLQTVRTIDPQSGRMTYLGTYAGPNNVQMLTYEYNSLGNLASREDGVQSLSEAFQYDAYSRLVQSSITGVGTKNWSYDDLGNIKVKDGYTDYTYGTAGNKPHAVLTARGSTYAYDANGNMTSGGGRTITWNSANLPTRIVKGGASAEFSYSPDRVRYRQVAVSGTTGTTTLYAGKLYEQANTNGITTHRNYIAAGGRVVAVRETVNSTVTMKYLHQDHLGSTDVITSSTGQVLERQSFDAFGTRRVANNWRDPIGMITSLYSSRGYTGHEQLDNVGLIHMNGRVYDPALGRFISADPHVQTPGNAQSLNRFSYVWNNPLAATDPSGYLRLSDLNPVRAIRNIGRSIDKHIIQPIGDAFGVDKKDFLKYGLPVIGVFTAPWAGLYIGTTLGLSTTAGYAMTGLAGGLIASGGDIRAGVAGSITALGLYGIQSFYGNTWTLGRVVSSGTVGGISSVMQGGRFENGFKLNFVASTLTYLNYSMRDAMIAQSNLMPCAAETSCNSNGVSSGLRGDGFKLAGARQLVDAAGRLLGFQRCESPAGGCQGAGGQAANLVGFEYSQGGPIDRLVESFAGPHDWLRSRTGAYDIGGNSVQYNGVYGLMQDYAMNYGLLVPAAPIAVAGLIAEYPVMQMMVGSSSGRW